MKKRTIIIISVLGLLAVSGGVYYYFTRKKELKIGSKEANQVLEDMQMY